jgi:uncharacterized protein YjcR
MRYKAYGEDNNSTSLTERDVRSIREMYAQGFLQNRIAEFYSISPSTVHRIVHQETWQHIIQSST